ncbi:hypothetical protein [Thermoflavimicrobium dichotomicum]|uniref:Uncharacterized protein n=1 Tax=Thermoflavimicrobium dichotomicum TaxID=46223 RepID=A0A1I3NKQ5_9BACL|nr:hypothetical protein [Thermoflavimicrobium dichotomicum]SFJ09948.1 hypothetical protein SAMN05421852_104187 [Thermoflavimicrobium dichotomicum]
MEANRLKELRKKQWIYQNVIFLVYTVLFFGLLLSQASSLAVFLVLGGSLILSSVIVFLTKRPHFLLTIFPQMKELVKYEREKLGEAWFKYYLSNMILPVVVGLVLFIQIFFRANSQTPLISGIPIWYFIVAWAILILAGNLNLRFHIRRMDQQTAEELRAFAHEKMVFSILFSSVVLVISILAAIFVALVT